MNETNLFCEYSKTPIYRASRGKGKRPGKSGDTVNRGTEKIDQNSAYLRFKMINYALQLHPLVYAFHRFTYSIILLSISEENTSSNVYVVL
jgi:hypothetical protein